MSDGPTIAVFRQKPHGLPADELVELLRERLPTASVLRCATSRDERTAIADADVVVGQSMTEDLLAEAENLSLFACSFAGYDHLPLSAFERRGVTVTNAAGVHASNAAEHAIGGLLALTRGLFDARRRQRNREWRNVRTGELAGGGVTVVGMGAIGEAVCERLAPFGVDITAVRHSPEKGGPADTVVGYDEVESAVVDASAVVLACPLTDTTRHLLDRALLKTLHPDAIVVNVARGGVVDTDALVASLRANHVGGAVLDVTDPEPLPTDHPLWTFENVLITPHNAGYTPEYHERLANLVAENVETAMASGEWTGLENQVLP